MAPLTASIKRAPRWAYYVAGGLGLGVVGIEIFKRRATDATTSTDAQTIGSSSGTSGSTAAPSPVITPPVVIQPTPQDTGNLADLVSVFASTFGSSLDNLVGNIGQLAAGDQALAGGLATSLENISTTALAGAGQAPAPAITVGPIISGPPSSHPHAPHIRGATACPGSFPRYNPAAGAPGPKSCYKCEPNPRNRQYPVTHRYQNGHPVNVKSC